MDGICFFVYFDSYLFKNVYDTFIYHFQIGQIIMDDAVHILTVGEIKSRLN